MNPPDRTIRAGYQQEDVVVTLRHEIELCDECVQTIYEMSRFYRIGMDELLIRAVTAGLAQAEQIMLANEAHPAADVCGESMRGWSRRGPMQ